MCSFFYMVQMTTKVTKSMQSSSQSQQYNSPSYFIVSLSRRWSAPGLHSWANRDCTSGVYLHVERLQLEVCGMHSLPERLRRLARAQRQVGRQVTPQPLQLEIPLREQTVVDVLGTWGQVRPQVTGQVSWKFRSGDTL